MKRANWWAWVVWAVVMCGGCGGGGESAPEGSEVAADSGSPEDDAEADEADAGDVDDDAQGVDDALDTGTVDAAGDAGADAAADATADATPDVPGEQDAKLPARGIVYLPDGPLVDVRAAFDNPAIDGVKLRLGWREVEPSPGAYVWDALDAHLDAARDAGKFVSFSVVAGSASPTWLVNDPAVEVIEVERRGRVVPFALPWDPVVVEAWLRFVRAFGARYDDDPHLAYVTASGFGWAVETTLPPYDGFTTATLDTWREAAAEVLRGYGEAFAKTPFTLALHNGLLTGRDPQPTFELLLNELYETFPRRLGLENHGLNATSSAAQGSEDANLHQRLSEASPDRPVVYQLVCSTRSNAVCQPEWVRGSLGEALEAGVALGAQTLEVYANDCDAPDNLETLRDAAARLAPAP